MVGNNISKEFRRYRSVFSLGHLNREAPAGGPELGGCHKGYISSGGI